jgi:hypothetical protein
MTISASYESSFRASDVAQANSETCSAGWDQDLLLPSKWRAIAIKLNEFGQPCCVHCVGTHGEGAHRRLYRVSVLAGHYVWGEGLFLREMKNTKAAAEIQG